MTRNLKDKCPIFIKKLADSLYRFFKFGLVGASGIIVNMGLLWIFRELLHLPFFISGFLAIELSIVTNFVLNDIWTWRDRRNRSFVSRLIRYNAAAAFTAFGFNYLVLLVAVYAFGINYIPANLFGIIVASLLNFFINHNWTYSAGQKKESGGFQHLDGEFLLLF
jgi:dolichol-phosphate mannosyltransferase